MANLNPLNFVANPFDKSVPVLDDEGYITLYYTPSVIDLNNCGNYTVKSVDTLQGIAALYYGDSGLWYIIAEANEILNPLREVIPGMILLIPNNYG